MLAFVGWCIQESGSHWAGYFDLEQTISFASVSKLDFYESWYAVPPQGRLQIITLIGWIEWVTMAVYSTQGVVWGGPASQTSQGSFSAVSMPNLGS